MSSGTRRLRIWPVLLLSGALGGICGGLLAPSWQDVVEPAQVLAGVVRYEPHQPLYLYATQTWTLLHQVTALLIRLGVTEWWLSIAWSTALGALGFQAVALTARALGAPWVIAGLSPATLWVSGMTLLPHNYHSPLLGWRGTYGLVAHALLLLVIALLAVRRDRSAAFLLGLYPAVHVTMGVWAWVVVGLVVLVEPHEWRVRQRQAARWWALGLGLSVISLVVHWVWFVGPAPEVSIGTEAILREVRKYDAHRQLFSWLTPRYPVMVSLPFVLLHVQRRWFSGHPEARALGYAFAAATVVAVASDGLVRVTSELVGAWISRPMPTRLMTLSSLGAGAWMIGLAASGSAAPAVRLLGCACFSVITVWAMAVLRWSEVIDALTAGGIHPGIAALVLNVAGIAALVAGTHASDAWQVRCERAAGRAVRVLTVLLVCLTGAVVVTALLTGRANLATVVDARTDPVYGAAAARPGVLLTTLQDHLVQGPTRRPVLLDYDALDSVIYVPSAAGQVDHILQRVYGRGLVPPVDTGALSVWDIEESKLTFLVWHARGLADWQAIRQEFGVTDVLTPTDWRLSLPLVVRGADQALWTIPVAPQATLTRRSP